MAQKVDEGISQVLSVEKAHRQVDVVVSRTKATRVQKVQEHRRTERVGDVPQNRRCWLVERRGRSTLILCCPCDLSLRTLAVTPFLRWHTRAITLLRDSVLPHCLGQSGSTNRRRTQRLRKRPPRRCFFLEWHTVEPRLLNLRQWVWCPRRRGKPVGETHGVQIIGHDIEEIDCVGTCPTQVDTSTLLVTGTPLEVRAILRALDMLILFHNVQDWFVP
mmetsp:Transcript_52475/g.139697  ORF Transcript_52475/g.139697 Transcript_52475/m.139697 type:complete len:218 (-) Transcript_52475:160-813(-)